MVACAGSAAAAARAVARSVAMVVAAGVVVALCRAGRPARARCAATSEVWVVRHGEKTMPPVTDEDRFDLNASGRARAAYLGELVRDGAWPRFASVFAASPEKKPFVRRELETVHPAADAAGVAVDATLGVEETEGAAAAALASARAFAAARPNACGRAPVVLVGWEHCRMPRLLRALGCASERCAACWSDADYDSVVRLRVFDDGRVDELPRAAEGFRPPGPYSFGQCPSEDTCVPPPRRH